MSGPPLLRLASGVALALVVAVPASLDAQVEVPVSADTLPTPDLAEPAPVSPGGAFVRSLVLPGWGHIASNAPARGAFYITAQSATFWMIVKSVVRRRSAAQFRESERELVKAELRLQGVQNPDSLQFLSDDDPRVERWEELRETRSQQVEDWVSLGIFLTLLGAADAFVASHLSDFPEPLTFDVLPGAGSRGVEFRMSYPLGGDRPRFRP